VGSWGLTEATPIRERDVYMAACRVGDGAKGLAGTADGAKAWSSATWVGPREQPRSRQDWGRRSRQDCRHHITGRARGPIIRSVNGPWSSFRALFNLSKKIRSNLICPTLYSVKIRYQLPPLASIYVIIEQAITPMNTCSIPLLAHSRDRRS
jgi:hypothetical protein